MRDLQREGELIERDDRIGYRCAGKRVTKDEGIGRSFVGYWLGEGTDG